MLEIPGPGMVIDIERHAPVLGFGRGGLSGPALKPLRCDAFMIFTKR